jgi:DNA-binding XRE family transcriptional regulator
MKTRGTRVKAVREYLGMTQTEFAASIEITPGAVWQIEKDKGVSLSTLLNISHKHGISYQWLLDGSGKMIEPIRAQLTEKDFWLIIEDQRRTIILLEKIVAKKLKLT